MVVLLDAAVEIEAGASTTCHDQTISGGHDLVQDTRVCANPNQAVSTFVLLDQW